jgi:hypothetical protein
MEISFPGFLTLFQAFKNFKKSFRIERSKKINKREQKGMERNKNEWKILT